jgi:predicted alpha/beta-fold hydrolase
VTGCLHKIKVPTIFLNAEDDPCFDGKLNPIKEFEGASDHILLAFTKRGGHCGHFTGGLIPQQWHPNLFLEFLEFLESKRLNPSNHMKTE